MIRKIFAHSFLYSMGPVITQLGALVLLPFLTPHLTAYDFGVFGIITSYLFFITALKDLGFNVVFVNTYYKHPHRWQFIWKMLYGHLIYWSIIYFILQVTLLYFAIPGPEMHNFPFLLVLVAFPAIIFDSVNSISNYYYRFTEKPVIIATVTAAGGVVSLVVLYYCVVVLKLGYMGWFISNFSSALVMFLCYAYPFVFKLKLTPILKIRRKFIIPYLKVALPMIPHNYSTYLLNSSDRVVMDLMKINVAQIGLYNVAYRFGNYFEFGGEAMGMAIGPQYAKLYSENKPESLQLARRLTFFLMAAFIAFAFTVSLWLKEIFQLLFRNPELQTAYGIGIIIFMGYTYRPMYWSSVIRLSTAEKTNMLWRVSFVAGVVNIILNVLFLKTYGIFAAAVSTFISLLYIGFAAFYLPAYRKMNNPNHYPHIWIALIIGFTLLAWFLRDIGWEWKAAVSFLFMTVAVFVYLKYWKIKKQVANVPKP